MSPIDPRSWIETTFPRLGASSDYQHISPYDEDYNCIAFAAGDTERWWWPPVSFPGGSYWPPEAPSELTVEAFTSAFESLGYSKCEHGQPEDGFEKVALYVKDGVPTHAARQLPSEGVWISKLGKAFDIHHDDVAAVGGDIYGEVAVFMRRPLGDAGS